MATPCPSLPTPFQIATTQLCPSGSTEERVAVHALHQLLSDPSKKCMQLTVPLRLQRCLNLLRDITATLVALDVMSHTEEPRDYLVIAPNWRLVKKMQGEVMQAVLAVDSAIAQKVIRYSVGGQLWIEFSPDCITKLQFMSARLTRPLRGIEASNTVYVIGSVTDEIQQQVLNPLSEVESTRVVRVNVETRWCQLSATVE